jgi:hypothetical protein
MYSDPQAQIPSVLDLGHGRARMANQKLASSPTPLSCGPEYPPMHTGSSCFTEYAGTAMASTEAERRVGNAILYIRI